MSYENSIAFLGPAGTYCNEAALRFAARLGIDDPDLVECASFDEVFDCVDDGTVRFGVVGKENSLEGPVTATLDNFAFRTDSVSGDASRGRSIRHSQDRLPSAGHRAVPPLSGGAF